MNLNKKKFHMYLKSRVKANSRKGKVIFKRNAPPNENDKIFNDVSIPSHIK